MGSTVDGLVTGLDTTTIISQLMQLQAAPQARLKTSLTSAQSQVLAFQTINTSMAALQAAADKLSQAGAWTPATATSSSSSVTAAAGAGALTGSTTFSVTSVATAASVISTRQFSSLTATTGADALADAKFEIRSADGSTRTVVEPKDSSLSALVTAINADPKSGVRAAAVQVSAGVFKLQLTANDTGIANRFSFVPQSAPVPPATADLEFGTVTTAADAVLHVGDKAAGFDITSASNTVEGVMPGVTVKVSALADDVTVTTGRDQAAITASVKALVDAANAALGSIKNQTTQGVVSTSGTRSGAGALASDSQMKGVINQIMSTVTRGVGGASLSSVGISSTRAGALTFDAATFGKALTKDPEATKALFASKATDGSGLAEQLAKLGKDTSASDGSIARAIEGRKSTIIDLTDRISDWDDRLATRKAALQRQYASLETALGKLKSQSTWLAGQLNALSNTGSDS